MFAILLPYLSSSACPYDDHGEGAAKLGTGLRAPLRYAPVRGVWPLLHHDYSVFDLVSVTETALALHGLESLVRDSPPQEHCCGTVCLERCAPYPDCKILS